MDAAAHNPAFAKQAGVPVSVAKEFSAESKGLKFGKGTKSRADVQRANKADTEHGKSKLFSKGGDMKESKAMVKKEISFMKKAGAPKSMIKHEKAEAGMKKGGMPSALAKHAAKPASVAHKGLKSGGAVDGVASKGKTKGTMIKMARGGRSC